MSDIVMSYGSYNFNPIPLMGLTREYKKSDDGRILFSTLRISLEGTLATVSGGLSTITSLESGLRNAFNTQGENFVLTCNSAILLSGNPRINNIAVRNSPNNWVNSLGYTIDLEYEDNITGEFASDKYVTNIVDDWTLEPIDDRYYFAWNNVATGIQTWKLNHQLSAVGVLSYSGGSSPIQEPWEYAKAFCTGHMGFSTSKFGLSTGITAYNHSRTQSMNDKAGKYALNETWLLAESGINNTALEEFTINIRTNNSTDIVTTNIQGTIQGLETATYGNIDIINKTISTSKWASASGYWDNIKNSLFTRANVATSGGVDGFSRSLVSIPVSKTIGESPSRGIITYDIEYNNRSSLCIEGALQENIAFNYDYPTDVFASISVLGRKSGPIIQLMDTRTPYHMTMTVDVVVPIVTGCGTGLLISSTGCPHSKVKTLMSTIESDIYTHSTVVKENDKISWNPKEGKYNRTVSWLYNDCSGSGTKVSDLT